MFEFIRVLKQDEIKVLKAINWQENGRDRRFNRYPAISYQKISRYIKNLYQPYGPEYKKISEALQDIDKFIRRKTTVQSCLSSIDILLKEEEDSALGASLIRVAKIFRKAQQKAEQFCGELTAEQQETIREYLDTQQHPVYFRGGFKPLCELPNERIERIARGLQGIVSIEMGDYGQYLDLFVPQSVYENAVLPANEDQRNRFIIEVRDERLTQILGFIYKKTFELRKKWGSSFRPEFTRPELSRFLEIKMPQSKEFRKLMLPLEGILGRIERKCSFVDKNMDKKRPYMIYYSKPSWFLSLYHQRLLTHGLQITQVLSS